jgi:hypothetical protein
MTATTQRVSLELAREMLAGVKRATICPQDYVTHAQLGHQAESQIAEVMKRHGFRGFRLIQCQLKLLIARLCCHTSADQLHRERAIEEPLISQLVCTAKFWGVGACSELAHLLWFQDPRFIVVTTGPCLSEQATPQQIEQSHSFVVCNISQKAVAAGSPLKQLAGQPGALIIDPFFNFACPVRKLESEGKPLIDYWKAYRHCLIMGSRWHQNFDKDALMMTRNIELVHRATQEHRFLQVAYRHAEVVRIRDRLYNIVNKVYRPQLLSALAELVPKTHWSMRMLADGSYDCAMTAPQQIQATRTQLKTHRIDHLATDTEVALHNPDPDRLIARVFWQTISSRTGLPSRPLQLILALAELY